MDSNNSDSVLCGWSISSGEGGCFDPECPPEFQNLKTDLENDLKDFILNLDFMYTILHSSSMIYDLSDNLPYDEVLLKLKEFMLERGLAIPLNSFNKTNLLIHNDSIARRMTHEYVFTERLKKLSNTNLTCNFWCLFVYEIMTQGIKIDESYYRSFFTHFIDDEPLTDDYKIMTYVPEHEEIDEDEIDYDLDDFLIMT